MRLPGRSPGQTGTQSGSVHHGLRRAELFSGDLQGFHGQSSWARPVLFAPKASISAWVSRYAEACGSGGGQTRHLESTSLAGAMERGVAKAKIRRVRSMELQ